MQPIFVSFVVTKLSGSITVLWLVTAAKDFSGEGISFSVIRAVHLGFNTLRTLNSTIQFDGLCQAFKDKFLIVEEQKLTLNGLLGVFE